MEDVEEAFLDLLFLNRRGSGQGNTVGSPRGLAGGGKEIHSSTFSWAFYIIMGTLGLCGSVAFMIMLIIEKFDNVFDQETDTKLDLPSEGNVQEKPVRESVPLWKQIDEAEESIHLISPPAPPPSPDSTLHHSIQLPISMMPLGGGGDEPSIIFRHYEDGKRRTSASEPTFWCHWSNQIKDQQHEVTNVRENNELQPGVAEQNYHEVNLQTVVTDIAVSEISVPDIGVPDIAVPDIGVPHIAVPHVAEEKKACEVKRPEHVESNTPIQASNVKIESVVPTDSLDKVDGYTDWVKDKLKQKRREGVNMMASFQTMRYSVEEDTRTKCFTTGADAMYIGNNGLEHIGDGITSNAECGQKVKNQNKERGDELFSKQQVKKEHAREVKLNPVTIDNFTEVTCLDAAAASLRAERDSESSSYVTESSYSQTPITNTMTTGSFNYTGSQNDSPSADSSSEKKIGKSGILKTKHIGVEIPQKSPFVFSESTLCVKNYQTKRRVVGRKQGGQLRQSESTHSDSADKHKTPWNQKKDPLKSNGSKVVIKAEKDVRRIDRLANTISSGIQKKTSRHKLSPQKSRDKIKNYPNRIDNKIYQPGRRPQDVFDGNYFKADVDTNLRGVRANASCTRKSSTTLQNKWNEHESDLQNKWDEHESDLQNKWHERDSSSADSNDFRARSFFNGIANDRRLVMVTDKPYQEDDGIKTKGRLKSPLLRSSGDHRGSQMVHIDQYGLSYPLSMNNSRRKDKPLDGASVLNFATQHDTSRYVQTPQFIFDNSTKVTTPYFHKPKEDKFSKPQPCGNALASQCGKKENLYDNFTKYEANAGKIIEETNFSKLSQQAMGIPNQTKIKEKIKSPELNNFSSKIKTNNFMKTRKKPILTGRFDDSIPRGIDLLKEMTMHVDDFHTMYEGQTSPSYTGAYEIRKDRKQRLKSDAYHQDQLKPMLNTLNGQCPEINQLAQSGVDHFAKSLGPIINNEYKIREPMCDIKSATLGQINKSKAVPNQRAMFPTSKVDKDGESILFARLMNRSLNVENVDRLRNTYDSDTSRSKLLPMRPEMKRSDAYKRKVQVQQHTFSTQPSVSVQGRDVSDHTTRASLTLSAGEVRRVGDKEIKIYGWAGLSDTDSDGLFQVSDVPLDGSEDNGSIFSLKVNAKVDAPIDHLQEPEQQDFSVIGSKESSTPTKPLSCKSTYRMAKESKKMEHHIKKDFKREFPRSRKRLCPVAGNSDEMKPQRITSVKEKCDSPSSLGAMRKTRNKANVLKEDTIEPVSSGSKADKTPSPGFVARLVKPHIRKLGRKALASKKDYKLKPRHNPTQHDRKQNRAEKIKSNQNVENRANKIADVPLLQESPLNENINIEDALQPSLVSLTIYDATDPLTLAGVSSAEKLQVGLHSDKISEEKSIATLSNCCKDRSSLHPGPRLTKSHSSTRHSVSDVDGHSSHQLVHSDKCDELGLHSDSFSCADILKSPPTKASPISSSLLSSKKDNKEIRELSNIYPHAAANESMVSLTSPSKDLMPSNPVSGKKILNSPKREHSIVLPTTRSTRHITSSAQRLSRSGQAATAANLNRKERMKIDDKSAQMRQVRDSVSKSSRKNTESIMSSKQSSVSSPSKNIDESHTTMGNNFKFDSQIRTLKMLSPVCSETEPLSDKEIEKRDTCVTKIDGRGQGLAEPKSHLREQKMRSKSKEQNVTLLKPTRKTTVESPTLSSRLKERRVESNDRNSKLEEEKSNQINIAKHIHSEKDSEILQDSTTRQQGCNITDTKKTPHSERGIRRRSQPLKPCQIGRHTMLRSKRVREKSKHRENPESLGSEVQQKMHEMIQDKGLNKISSNPLLKTKHDNLVESKLIDRSSDKNIGQKRNPSKIDHVKSNEYDSSPTFRKGYRGKLSYSPNSSPSIRKSPVLHARRKNKEMKNPDKKERSSRSLSANSAITYDKSQISPDSRRSQSLTRSNESVSLCEESTIKENMPTGASEATENMNIIKNNRHNYSGGHDRKREPSTPNISKKYSEFRVENPKIMEKQSSLRGKKHNTYSQASCKTSKSGKTTQHKGEFDRGVRYNQNVIKNTIGPTLPDSEDQQKFKVPHIFHENFVSQRKRAISTNNSAVGFSRRGTHLTRWCRLRMCDRFIVVTLPRKRPRRRSPDDTVSKEAKVINRENDGVGTHTYDIDHVTWTSGLLGEGDGQTIPSLTSSNHVTALSEPTPRPHQQSVGGWARLKAQNSFNLDWYKPREPPRRRRYPERHGHITQARQPTVILVSQENSCDHASSIFSNDSCGTASQVQNMRGTDINSQVNIHQTQSSTDCAGTLTPNVSLEDRHILFVHQPLDKQSHLKPPVNDVYHEAIHSRSETPFETNLRSNNKQVHYDCSGLHRKNHPNVIRNHSTLEIVKQQTKSTTRDKKTKSASKPKPLIRSASCPNFQGEIFFTYET